MVYPAYFPNPYQNPYQQGFFQQPAPQPTAQPQQAQPSSILWVGGIGEAQMYPVAPNNAVALWDSSAPAIYLKQADAAGKPSIKIYDLVERSQDVLSARMEEPAYARKSDVELLNSALEGLKKDVNKLRSEWEART